MTTVTITSGAEDRPRGGGAGRHASGGVDELEPHFTVFDVVTDLRRDVAALAFPLEIHEVDQARAQRERLLGQLDDHLLPRLKELSSPAVVVIAGSTGAGKSTLINSLLRQEISRASVIRPTTREPVLAYNPQDEEILEGTPLQTTIRSVANAEVPRGIALLDAPDLDSVLDENREIAARLLEGADLWLFVTTAARYGDALPWKTLQGAMQRGATVAMVLNRAPAASLTTVRGDLLQRLREHGMDNVPLFVVPDAGPHEGLLPATSVAPIGRWLRTLGGTDRARTVILRTLRGSLVALPPWAEELSEHVEAQILAGQRIAAAADAALPPVAQAVGGVVRSGALARGAVESRWSQLVRPARLDKAISRSGLARGSGRRGRSRSESLGPLVEAVRSAALVALAAALDDARAALVDALTAVQGGTTVLPQAPPAASDEERTASVVDGWLAAARSTIDGLDAVGSKQLTAAVRAFGPEGLHAILVAAAIGHGDAEALVGRVLGNVGRDLVAPTTEELADLAATLVGEEIGAVRAALAAPALAAEAAVGLRVRLAELAQFT